MSRELIFSDKGFTYLAALFLLMVMGIMAGMVGETWSMVMHRDREEELLFRGKQIMTAIKRFQEVKEHPSVPLADLRALYESDPRFLERRRYLRKNYPDPITGKEWKLLKDPAKGIIGVASSSDQEPLKKTNFPEEFKEFEKKEKYSMWQFVNKQTTAPGAAGTPGTAAAPVKPVITAPAGAGTATAGK